MKDGQGGGGVDSRCWRLAQMCRQRGKGAEFEVSLGFQLNAYVDVDAIFSKGKRSELWC